MPDPRKVSKIRLSGFEYDIFDHDTFDKMEAFIARRDNPHEVNALQVGASNQSIIINGDFRAGVVVNTRGLTEYDGAVGNIWTVDMWRFGGNITPERRLILYDSHVHINIGTAIGSFNQFIQVPELYAGKTLTLSIICRNAQNIEFGIIALNNMYRELSTSSTFELQTFTFSIPNTATNLIITWRGLGGGPASIDVQRVKLELGSVSTLANDPPANHNVQHLKAVGVSPYTVLPNLLDSWWFGEGVINQRGQSLYTMTARGYTLDRWTAVNGTVAVDPQGFVTIASTSGAQNRFRHPIEFPERLRGKTLTFSALLRTRGELGIHLRFMGAEEGGTLDHISSLVVNTHGDWQIASLTTVMPDNLKQLEVNIQVTPVGLFCDIQAVELVEGSVSTLRNQPPPKPGAILAECQRHQIVFPNLVKSERAGNARGTTANNIDFFFPMPTTLRINPTPSQTANIYNSAGVLQEGFTFAYSTFPNGVRVTATKVAHGLQAGSTCELPAGTILDANL